MEVQKSQNLNFFYFSEIIETLKDHPNKYALEIFTIGCNFKCFHCHNYEELNKPDVLTYNFDDLLENL